MRKGLKELIENLKQEEVGITHQVTLLADITEQGFWVEEKERLKEGCKHKIELYTEVHYTEERIVFRRGQKVNVANRGANEFVIWIEEEGEVVEAVRGEGAVEGLWEFCYDEDRLYDDAQEIKDKAGELTVLIWKMKARYTGRGRDGTAEMFELANTLINKGVDIIRAFAVVEAKKAPVERFIYDCQKIEV